MTRKFLHARFQNFLVILFVPYDISQAIMFLIREGKQDNKSNHAFWVWKTQDENKEERNTSMKKEGIKKYEQTITAEIEEEEVVVAP